MLLNKYLPRFTFFIFSMLVSQMLYAQDKPVMADVMRSNGKIYVVVVVCLIILTGLFLYVMNVERKLRKLEKEQN